MNDELICTCTVPIIDAMGAYDLTDPRCARHGNDPGAQIQRLRHEVKRLRQALRYYASGDHMRDYTHGVDTTAVARKALEGKD